MERAYLRRDASYDGIFFVAVRTTGVFCRPSCPARKPRPANVEYFDSSHAALCAGYRPCKRCRPLHTDGRPPQWVERLLQQADAAPTARVRDTDVRHLGIDPARARRYFKRHFGMTFQAYNRARRMGTALREIRRGANLTRVGLDHGFASNSGFRDAFERTFGQPPGQARGSDCLTTQMIESPLGPLLACATSEAVCLLEYTDRRALETQVKALRKRFGCAIVPGTNPVLARLSDELAEYFAGQRRKFTVPVAYPGTPFQQAVWRELMRIPYGANISYEELARRVKRPGAQRAVGLANGKNRIAILIPCHRVVNKNGQLGGYGGGLWRKQKLLDIERGARS